MSIATDEALEWHGLHGDENGDRDSSYSADELDDAYIAGRTAEPTEDEIEAAARVFFEDPHSQSSLLDWDKAPDYLKDNWRFETRLALAAARKSVMSIETDEAEIKAVNQLRESTKKKEGIMNSNGYAYMVTDGEYSDYRVICVGDDKEKLQKFADEHGFEVEDVPALTDENEVVRKFDAVSFIDSVGRIRFIRQESTEDYKFVNANTPIQYSFDYLDAQCFARINISGVDLERVMKCAGEKSAKVAQMIVDGMTQKQVVDLMNNKDAKMQ